MTEPAAPILQVKNLRTYFKTDQGLAKSVDDVSFALHPGRTLAVVGESGCGKSVTALSIMGLVPEPPGVRAGGEILFGGRDLLQLPQRELRAIRGNDISMIFQEPMTSMNPVFRVGAQISASIQLHLGLDKKAAREEAIRLLGLVGIPVPERRVDNYPHEMSGGMLQRAMIAMALAADPAVLIADEPTTALDVTIQAQILDLLRKLQDERGMSILLITHDLGVVAENAHDVVVMYAGKVVERAPVRELFARPRHPYTLGLFASLPRHDTRLERLHVIRGNVPAATAFPPGCRFHSRCPYAVDRCRESVPPLESVGEGGHEAACWELDRVAPQETVLAANKPSDDTP
ncbi:MAG: ABC transporter ATP-binding protein [Candidatus Hydrogenedentes bacterium]|nr:ABC transporter ATP-binding protein [Candidatus Hydrogenedentota bacterium]